MRLQWMRTAPSDPPATGGAAHKRPRASGLG
jgi:hypothetical protein